MIFGNLLVRRFLHRVARSNDTRTTVLGLLAAALLAANLDWGALLAGDQGQIGELLGVLVVALWGIFTNKPDRPERAK